MKYFVLKPRGTDIFARASRNALRTYASTLYAEKNRHFANQIRAWVEQEELNAENEMSEEGVKCCEES
jgi:hypothetical protein